MFSGSAKVLSDPTVDRGGAFSLGVSLLLHGLQSPINVGSILRVAETFGVDVEFWDAHGLLSVPEKRSRIADFSCGAFQRGTCRTIDAPPPASRPGGRVVATSPDPGGIALTAFRFQAGDVIAIGNEYDGLPANFVEAADLRLWIPMPPTVTPYVRSENPIDPARAAAIEDDGAPVLSAGMSAGIICYAAFTQLGGRPSPKA